MYVYIFKNKKTIYKYQLNQKYKNNIKLLFQKTSLACSPQIDCTTTDQLISHFFIASISVGLFTTDMYLCGIVTTESVATKLMGFFHPK
jgi:hypothetical protein